jgi:hypothetical protein
MARTAAGGKRQKGRQNLHFGEKVMQKVAEDKKFK